MPVIRKILLPVSVSGGSSVGPLSGGVEKGLIQRCSLRQKWKAPEVLQSACLVYLVVPLLDRFRNNRSRKIDQGI